MEVQPTVKKDRLNTVPVSDTDFIKLKIEITKWFKKYPKAKKLYIASNGAKRFYIRNSILSIIETIYDSKLPAKLFSYTGDYSIRIALNRIFVELCTENP